jgi:hypothetical protein
MRNAYRFEIKNDSNNVYVAFGADYCAEHEWGIDGIHSSLDCFDKEINGPERYLIKNPDNVHIMNLKFSKNKIFYNKVILYGGNPLYTKEEEIRIVIRDHYHNSITSMWDGKAFCFSVDDDTKEAKNLRLVYDAIKGYNAVLFMGGNGVFSNSGPVIARYSTIPIEIKKKIKDQHIDAIKLKQTSEETGIVERVNKGIKGIFGEGAPYFALSPAWLNNNEKNSKYKVHYWLNPTNQNKVNYGWFTVEELDEWIKGTGPIPKINK